MDTVIAYTDGNARGNPGPAAAGVYITDADGTMLKEAKESIGNSTSNFAQYYGVMLALQTLNQMYGEKTLEMQFEIRLAGEFVKKQLNAESQVTEPGLVPMFIEIHNMRVANFPNLLLTLIPQEKNQEAVRLVNEALDKK